MNFNKINMSKDEQNIVFPRKSQRTSQHGTKNMNSTNPTTNKKKPGTNLPVYWSELDVKMIDLLNM